MQRCRDGQSTGVYLFGTQQRKQPNQAHATRRTRMPTSGLVTECVPGAFPVRRPDRSRSLIRFQPVETQLLSRGPWGRGAQTTVPSFVEKKHKVPFLR